MTEDLELLEMESATVEGGWRLLCTSVLYEAVALLNGGGEYDGRSIAPYMEEARRWVARGDQGVITFDEVAELLGYDPDILREKCLKMRAKAFRKPAYRRDYARVQQWRPRT